MSRDSTYRPVTYRLVTKRLVTDDQTRIAAEILRLTELRGPAASISPSDVARSLADDWRKLLGPIRREATRLARDGRIDILRKGRAIQPVDMRGVIRLRLRRPEGGRAETSGAETI